MIFKNTGQNTLEICLAIIIGIILILGAISAWNWFNKTMAERLDSYKATRHIAGTTDFGRQVDYTPDNFDIFCITSTLNPVPGDEIPDLSEDPELQHCYDEFEQMINLSQELFNESIVAQQEAGEILAEYTILKSTLGNFTVLDWPWPIWQRFDGWLFSPLPNSGEIFYTSSWDAIGDQFPTKAGGCAFRDDSGISTSSVIIMNSYINVGITLEDASEAKAAEATEKMQQSQELAEEAPDFLIECLGGQAPGADPCLEQCYEEFGEPAQQMVAQVNEVCYGGNFALCEQLMGELQILQEQYMNCTDDCN